MSFSSGLYHGLVTHQRIRPRRHRLRYRIFQMLVDLDELETLDGRLRLFAHNRPGLLSLHDRDHGPCDGSPLRPYVEARLHEAGIDLRGGKVLLLTMPRVLGYIFNPLSLYFCHRRSGELAAILYEVRNTFGERHSYLIPVDDRPGALVRQGCRKLFHVSPFMDMEQSYAFSIRPPGQDVHIGVRSADAEGPLLLALFTAERRELSDAAILRSVLAAPLLGLKVVGAIHWEALKMWLKGLRLKPRPPSPAEAVTVVRSAPLRRAA